MRETAFSLKLDEHFQRVTTPPEELLTEGMKRDKMKRNMTNEHLSWQSDWKIVVVSSEMTKFQFRSSLDRLLQEKESLGGAVIIQTGGKVV